MKKQAKQLLLVLVLLAVAVAAFLLLRQPEGAVAEPPAEEAQETYVAGGADQPLVKSLEVRGAQDSFTIENGFPTAEAWREAPDKTHRLEGLAADSLNQSLLESALSAFSALTAKQVVAENGANLAEYGLDSPQATVTAHYEGSAVTLQIGDDAPGGAGIYVTAGEAVYLIDRAKVANLLGSRLDFVSKTATPGNAQTTQISKAVLEGERFAQSLVIEKDLEDQSDLAQFTGGYKLVSPLQCSADFSEGITPLQSVFGLAADEVVSIAGYLDATAAEYGLAEPFLRIALTPLSEEGAVAVDSFEIAFSAADDDGNVCFQTDRTDYVYRVAAASLPFYELKTFDYQDKMVILPPINSLSQIEIVESDMVVLFELSGEGEELTVKLGDRVLDTAAFRTFYQQLISARYDSEIDTEAEAEVTDAESFEAVAGDATAPQPEESAPDAGGPDSPQIEDPSAGFLLTITYRYRDGAAEDKVVFLPGPPRRALVALNGGRAYYTPSSYVDQLIDAMGDLIAPEQTAP